MKAVLRLELAKLAGRRSLMYLLLPNLYTLFYTCALGLALATRSAGWTEFLASLVTSSLALHPYVCLTAYPMCLLMLCADLWGAEAADGTLRTLVLTQVPRGRLLAARVLLAAALVTCAFAVYFAVFFLDVAVLARVVPAAVWAKIGFAVGSGLVNMVPFAGAFFVGAVALALWVTLMALCANRTSTVGMLSVASLVALAVGLPMVEEWVRPGSTWSGLVFTQAWVELTGKEMLKAVLHGPGPWGASLARVAGVLAGNALVLYPACLWLFRRREFVD